MPRTQKYAVTESLVSLASSQRTAASLPDGDGRGVDAPSENRRISRGKRRISVGWSAAAVLGALSLAFLLCAQFVRLPGVPESPPRASERIMKKKGFLKVYPFLPDPETNVTGTYSIPLPFHPSAGDSLEDVLRGYPDRSDGRVSCYVSSPSRRRPCFFDRKWLDDRCSAADDFGYREKNGTFSPCLLVRIEETDDWRPAVYDEKYVDESWRDLYDPTFASLGCALKSTEERKETGSVEISPSKGFPVRFFPATDFDGSLYLMPAVTVRVRGIRVGENVTVRCWLRAANAYLLDDSGQTTVSFVQTRSESSTARTAGAASSSAGTRPPDPKANPEN